MASATASRPTRWTAGETRALALQVQLLQKTLIVPWSQFVYAEGSDAEVRIAFTTHDVLVTGSGLGSLLSEIALQHLAALREPQRTEKFTTAEGPSISALSVRKVE